MIEKILYDYLSTALNVPVYTMRPEDAPPTYITIDKTGGSKSNRVEVATVAIQSYAPTLLEVVQLDEEVKGAMEDIVELSAIGGVALMTDQNFPDLQRKVPRYQAVFTITYY